MPGRVARAAFLGPQRDAPIVQETLDRFSVEGPVATVTAGWQERENEDHELREHVGRETRNLHLYRRSLAVFRDDPDLSRAMHERQAKLRELQTFYRIRLRHAMDAVQEVRQRDDRHGQREEAMILAMQAVQRMDRNHLLRVRRIHREFETTWHPKRRPAVARERRELRGILRDMGALAVAGGHVVVLLNRLRLFDLSPYMDGKTVVAWSAGAMALSERVVLFHDRPPQGPGYAETLEAGLALAPGFVPLPHARQRLRLNDPNRVVLLSQRFAPALCMAMDEQAAAYWTPEDGWTGFHGMRRLEPDGSVTEMGAA